MISLRKYEDGDWSKIKEPTEPFSPLAPTSKFLEMTKYSVAVTGEQDGVVMACGGVTYIGDDDGVVWVKVSKKCLSHPYRWARTIKEVFNYIMEAIGELNLHTYVVEGFCKGDKLARMIGLKKTNEAEEYNGNLYYKYTVI